MLSPQNKAKKVPAIKNGPKGISDFKFFFFEIINPTPIIAPIKKAENKAKTILGQPKSKPIKNPSFTSPNPNPAPLVTRKIARKNVKDRKALKIVSLKVKKLPDPVISKTRLKTREIIIAGKTTLSGII